MYISPPASCKLCFLPVQQVAVQIDSAKNFRKSIRAMVDRLNKSIEEGSSSTKKGSAVNEPRDSLQNRTPAFQFRLLEKLLWGSGSTGAGKGGRAEGEGEGRDAENSILGEQAFKFRKNTDDCNFQFYYPFSDLFVLNAVVVKGSVLHQLGVGPSLSVPSRQGSFSSMLHGKDQSQSQKNLQHTAPLEGGSSSSSSNLPDRILIFASMQEMNANHGFEACSIPKSQNYTKWRLPTDFLSGNSLLYAHTHYIYTYILIDTSVV